MGKNKWFDNTFLPSLFAQAKGSELRLSWKQIEVCQRYMKEVDAGTIKHTRAALSYNWEGRAVYVDFGKISFGLTQDEKDEHARKTWFNRIVDHIKRRPEKKAQIIEKAIAKEQEAIDYFEEEENERYEEGFIRIEMLQAL